MSQKQWRQSVIKVEILAIVLLAGCDSGWTEPRKEPGPVPFSGPNVQITRLVQTRSTFETTYRKLLWDEGNGPIEAKERINPLVDAVPYQPKERRACTWGIVVLLHPDVMILSARETPAGSDKLEFHDWVYPSGARRDYIKQRMELITARGTELIIHAGTLIPWSNEMYVISTDPKIKSGPLTFVDDKATIALPKGNLVLTHHDDDVDVRRE